MKANLKVCSFLLFAILLLTSAAFADPPSRVARLSYMSGAVSVQPGGVDDWVGGGLNRPLTTADRVWTDRDSRAELQFGRMAVRMNSDTSLDLVDVSDDVVQLALDQGTLSVHVSRIYPDITYEVDTPSVAFTIRRPGDYRFNVDPDGGRSVITVWRGEGEAFGNNQNAFVRSREQHTFYTGEPLDQAFNAAPRFDSFDEWCNHRDDREYRAESARYVSPDVIGYDDLDQYGRWQNTSQYGPVWEPLSVSSGWAPYREGHWLWVDPWGWTWVDNEPWGFAPFHYGRWVNYDGRWAWCPGPRTERSYYAPAMVAWLGEGGSNSLNFGGGPSVGWFPLGYGEPYYPSYRTSPQYFQRVNETNTRIANITTITHNYNTNAANITNVHYMNQTVPGAVTVVPRQALINAQPVAKAAVQVPVNKVVSAPVVAAPAVSPAHTSIVGSHPPAATPPPAARAPKPVVANHTPPSKPVPFAAKQAAIASNGGRPLDASAEQKVRMTLPVATRTATVVPARSAKAPAAVPSAHAAPQPAPAVRPGTAPVAPAPATRPGAPAGGPAVASGPGPKPAPAPAAQPNRATSPAAPNRAATVPRPPERTAPQPSATMPGRAATPSARPEPRVTPELARPAAPAARPAEPPARPAPAARPAEPPARPAPAARPAETSHRPALAAPPAESPEHPAPAARSAERPVRPAPAARPAEPAAHPAPAARPAERPERPAPAARPAEPAVRPAPAARPAEPPARPAPAARPAEPPAHPEPAARPAVPPKKPAPPPKKDEHPNEEQHP